MPLPIPPQAVFLDVGGPIYPDETFIVAVTHALDDMLAERGRGPADRTAVRAVYDRIRAEQDGSLRTALAQDILGDRALRAELHDRTEPHWRHPPGSAFPDVVPFLRALRGRVVVGVLANQERSVADALRRDGIGEYVDVWGVSAIVGHEKPSPELFEWCLTEARTTADRAVHVGNRLDNDVRPAAALGMSTVWVLRGDAPDTPTPSQLAEPDLTVESLDGLAEILLGAR